MRDDSTVALNRKARHEFTIDDTFEAGLVLTGTEIKSIRAGKANIANAYARIERGEAWLIGADIAPFEQGNRNNHDPKRTRKLLLHRSQIDELLGKAKAKGQTIVPLKPVHHAGQGQARARPGPRQAAPRQAPRHRRPRLETRHGPPARRHPARASLAAEPGDGTDALRLPGDKRRPARGGRTGRRGRGTPAGTVSSPGTGSRSGSRTPTTRGS